MHSRRLVERLVCHHLGWPEGAGLYRGLQMLQQREVEPLDPSAAYTRCGSSVTGWGIPSPPERHQACPTSVDLATMLGALHRVLEAYPWI